MTEVLSQRSALRLASHCVEYLETKFLNEFSICVTPYTQGMLVPSVTIRMEGAEAPTLQVAINKCTTALNHQHDTILLSHRARGTEYGGAPEGEWETRDILAMQTAEPTFTPWGGGVLLYDATNSDVLGALALSGADELSEHRLALEVATNMGFR